MPRLPFIPNLNLYIVTCIDCRVDPAQILGVKLGEALGSAPSAAVSTRPS
jgi:carbonic anhydrase